MALRTALKLMEEVVAVVVARSATGCKNKTVTIMPEADRMVRG